jgi:transposase
MDRGIQIDRCQAKEEGRDIMAIELPDARQLSDPILEALRWRALRGRELGFNETQLADLLGLRRETVCRWWSAYQKGGLDAIPQDRTGRPLGSGRILDESQAVHLQSKLKGHHPDDWGIAAPLWTRRAVRDLIRNEYGIDMAIRTVGEYLKRWGYTPKKARRRTKKQEPEEVREWLENIYPAIAEAAERELGEIHWCDEKGVGANEFSGRGYAPVGETPEVEVASHPCQMNVISTITNDGHMRFMTYRETMTATVFLVFLSRLVQGAGKKIFLIVDRLPAHTTAAVEAWLQGREDKIEMFYLPRRAPELNPDEYLNNDIHSGVNAMRLPDNQSELRTNIQRFLHKLARLPEHVMSYFKNPFIHYAAGTV